MIKVGDLVVGRTLAGLGIVVQEALKPEYVWVHWMTGKHRDKRTLKWRELLIKYDGGKYGTHLLDWG